MQYPTFLLKNLTLYPLTCSGEQLEAGVEVNPSFAGYLSALGTASKEEVLQDFLGELAKPVSFRKRKHVRSYFHSYMDMLNQPEV